VEVFFLGYGLKFHESFHDYGYDLPKVTETIDRLIKKHMKDIEKIIINPVVHVNFIKKKPSY